MTQSPKAIATLLASARERVAEVTPAQLAGELSDGRVHLLVDVREPGEWAKGHIPGAIHAPRGMLEWYADPDSPAAIDAIVEARQGRVVVTCASGGRSLLAAQTLLDMGFGDVVSLVGGFNAWAAVHPVSTD